jgi:hypothetical protein
MSESAPSQHLVAARHPWVCFCRSLKPWLIEVNASPSMTADTDSDYRLKRALLNDLFDVVDLEGRRTGDEIT